MYSPQITDNLSPIPQITANGAMAIMYKDFCYIYPPGYYPEINEINGNHKMIASLIDGLYCFKLNQMPSNNISTICNVSAIILHNCLGCLNPQDTRILGFPSKFEICYVCPLAKLHKIPHHMIKQVFASRPLDIIHVLLKLNVSRVNNIF